jgi:hypothetical protein
MIKYITACDLCPKSCLGYANKIFWGISGDDFGEKNMLLRQASQSDSFIFILILPLFMKIGECSQL